MRDYVTPSQDTDTETKSLRKKTCINSFKARQAKKIFAAIAGTVRLFRA